MANGNLPGFLRAGPQCLKLYLEDMIYCFKNYEILTQSEKEKENFFVALYQSAFRDESNEPFSVVICGPELCKQDGIMKVSLASNIHDGCPLRLVLLL